MMIKCTHWFYVSVYAAVISASEHTIQGEVSMGSQYHLHMETQVCIMQCLHAVPNTGVRHSLESILYQVSLCVPVEDGFQLYSSTQCPPVLQAAVANVLGIPANAIDVSVRRVGGAYGAKVSRASWIAAASALAASATRR